MSSNVVDDRVVVVVYSCFVVVATIAFVVDIAVERMAYYSFATFFFFIRLLYYIDDRMNEHFSVSNTPVTTGSKRVTVD